MTEEEFLKADFVNRYATYIEEDNEIIDIDDFDIENKKKLLKKLSPSIKEFFLKYPEDWEHFYYRFESGINNKVKIRKNCYVYEVYTLDDGMIFSVGYTCGIEPELYPPQRGFEKLVYDKKGLALRIIKDNLSELEAYIFQQCYIEECVKQSGDEGLRRNEPFSCDEFSERKKKAKPDKSYVYKEPRYSLFFPENYEVKEPFDEVNIESLEAVYILGDQNNELSNWLWKANSRIFKSCCKSVKTVIVDNKIDYYDYYAFHQNGKQICAIEDVLAAIENISPDGLFGEKKGKKIKVPKYDKEKRDYIREFILKNREKIEQYELYMVSNLFPLNLWNDPFEFSLLKDADLNINYKPDIVGIIKYTIIFHNNEGDRYCMDMFNCYKELGLFDELKFELGKKKGYGVLLETVRELASIDNEL